MADVLVENQSLVDIADAIRLKLSTQDTFKPSEMAAAIEEIEGGGITPTGTINITENGTVNVTQYASANVNVPTVTPTGTKSITANGTYDVTEFASAEVNVPTGGADLGTKTITENGTYNASSDDLDGYSSVTVNVPSGASFSGLSVTLQNGRSGSIQVNPVLYDSVTQLYGNRFNIAANATDTKTYAYDGKYIYFFVTPGATVSYNGATATFLKNGQHFALEIPENFDSSIPFIISGT